eukprot:6594883-Prorocentrum_lima.AAC.1
MIAITNKGWRKMRVNHYSRRGVNTWNTNTPHFSRKGHALNFIIGLSLRLSFIIIAAIAHAISQI